MIKKFNAIQTNDTIDLVKKTDYSTKIDEIQIKILNDYKYVTTTEFNKLKLENFATRLKQAKLATKDDIANFVKKTDSDGKPMNIKNKFTSNKTRHVEAEKN